MDEFDKTLNNYISHHNKTFDFYFVKLKFELKFNNNFVPCIQTHSFYNADISNMKEYLLCCIDYFNLRGNTFYEINELVMETLNDKCNMTYQHYICQPMSMCERQINMNLAKNPQLINSLDRNKNHHLIRKYSHTI